jgi:hypothetical protein
LPGPELAATVSALSGPGWRCPGASDDELVGLLGRWAALESWAAAGKLGVVRELLRRRAGGGPSRRRRPGPGPQAGSGAAGQAAGAGQAVPGGPAVPAGQGAGGGRAGDDLPRVWQEGTGHEVAAALAVSVPGADKLIDVAWSLGARLPLTAALLADGVIDLVKAMAIVRELAVLDDGHAARAEALIAGELAGKTPGQVGRLAAAAACAVDPDGAARRREYAEREDARVRLWRENSGACALAGYGLPTDAALSANANVSARAAAYKRAAVDPEARMDQLRVLAFLDILNGVTAADRIARAQAAAETEDRAPGDPAPGDPAPGDSAPGDPIPGDRIRGHEDLADEGRAGEGHAGEDRAGEDRASEDLGAGEEDLGGDPRDESLSGAGAGGSGAAQRAGGGRGAASRPGGPEQQGGGADQQGGGADPGLAASVNLTLPLATLLGLADRPGDGHGLGPLDPALVRDLAAAAARNPHSQWCLTITDPNGHAIGHGCARPARPARSARAKRGTPQGGNRDGPWDLARRDGPGPAGGFGRWTLTLPGGRRFTVNLGPVPVTGCDHRHQSAGYQPGHTLRHLVQIRDGTCTFPGCSRHARHCDFEHAIPYHQGGPTCACNGGARSRRCHRVKQSPGWTLTQPRPGWHQWTTPSGRTYTQGPMKYPA